MGVAAWVACFETPFYICCMISFLFTMRGVLLYKMGPYNISCLVLQFGIDLPFLIDVIVGRRGPTVVGHEIFMNRARIARNIGDDYHRLAISLECMAETMLVDDALQYYPEGTHFMAFTHGGCVSIYNGRPYLSFLGG